MAHYTLDILKSSHIYSRLNRTNILQSKICGCFYCITTFQPSDVMEWTDNDQTAICPNCGIDSVIGDKSNYPVVDIEFLNEMKSFWF